MADIKQQQGSGATPIGGDDDVVHFDLSSHTDQETPNLHVTLDDEMPEESSNDIQIPSLQHFSLGTEENTPAPSPQKMTPFHLGGDGDDVMSLFETLLQKIETLKASHEDSIQHHNETIAQAKDAIKREEQDYNDKLEKMLSMLDNLKNKLAGTVSSSTPRSNKK